MCNNEVDACCFVAVCCAPCIALEGERCLSRDRTVALAVGILFALGTIVGIVMCCTTTSTHYNPYNGFYETVSNTRYLPAVIIGGGLVSLFCFASAANNQNKRRI